MTKNSLGLPLYRRSLAVDEDATTHLKILFYLKLATCMKTQTYLKQNTVGFGMPLPRTHIKRTFGCALKLFSFSVVFVDFFVRTYSYSYRVDSLIQKEKEYEWRMPKQHSSTTWVLARRSKKAF
jgi:hypothetical protein